MTEKLSEKPLRQKKVDELKKDWIKQIDKELVRQLSLFCKSFLEQNDAVKVKPNFDDVHALYVLKEYLQSEYSFMQYCNVYEDRDEIVYVISCETIDFFVKSENLLPQVLKHIRQKSYAIENYLCDKFFKRNFFVEE